MVLKTKDLVNIEFDELDMWNPILASIAYAIRCSHHSTLKATPGQLVFGRDMLLDLKFEPNYQQNIFDSYKKLDNPPEGMAVDLIVNNAKYKNDTVCDRYSALQGFAQSLSYLKRIFFRF